MAMQLYGTGRRKNAIARVRLVPGNGRMEINAKDLQSYFPTPALQAVVEAPLRAVGVLGKYDVIVRVQGGGISGQAGAVRHGLARALLSVDREMRVTLKRRGYLTRDPRMKERRKYGLKKARKAPQFSKR